uniref:Iron-binding zinc finger CDGSH type domain-containing protein n=1 Tax=Oncorhynchus mykiss TaxID=8022 RepID=A0A8L0DV58_ONCMY
LQNLWTKKPSLKTLAGPPGWLYCSASIRVTGFINKPVVTAKMPFRGKVTGGKCYVWCACGHSKKQPFCDGAHRTQAPSISPPHFTPEKDSTLMLCACKQTKNVPYCDGTHFKFTGSPL